MEKKEIVSENQNEEITHKEKGKLLKRLLIFLVVVTIIAITLGNIFPGLLWRKDLGIKYSQADYESVMDKLKFIKDLAPSTGTREDYEYIYGPVNNIDIELTSEELTAFFNEGRPSYYPLKGTQIKINLDGTIEASATANVDYFMRELLGNRYTREQVKQELAGLDILPDNVNVYVKFSGSVINNQSDVNIITATVQGIPVPDEHVKSSEGRNIVVEGINNIMAKYISESGASFDMIVVENEKIIFKGKVPSTLTRVTR